MPHASETLGPVVQLSHVSKIYGKGEGEVKALNNISLTVEQGTFTAIMGPSGSGKSTLLHCLAGLDTVDEGTVKVAGKTITALGDNALTKFRRENIGFIFQSFNLVPTLDARANIELPMRLMKKRIDPELFNLVIDQLGLADRLTHRPHELSGGQQQRVAVARALVSTPALLVADEPTGNLDSHSSSEVLGLLRSAVDELGQSVVMVTHDAHAATRADRVVVVRDGQIAADLVGASAAELIEVVA